MNILHLTDIHGYFSNIPNIAGEIEEADVIVLSGDITHFGREKQVKLIIKQILAYNHKIYAVTGNCDYADVERFLENEVININQRVVTFSGFQFVGIAGSLPCPGFTPNELSESEFCFYLDKLKEELLYDIPIILLSHQPPYNTITDKLSSGEHVGSTSVRDFIIEIQPLLCLCGHIHEGIGIDSIGKTKIVNPGPFRFGGYAVAKVMQDDADVVIKNINQ